MGSKSAEEWRWELAVEVHLPVLVGVAPVQFAGLIKEALLVEVEVKGEGWMWEVADVGLVQQLTSQGEPAQVESGVLLGFVPWVVSTALLQGEDGSSVAAALASPFVFASRPDTLASLWVDSSESSWCCDPCNKTDPSLGQVFSPTQQAFPD